MIRVHCSTTSVLTMEAVCRGHIWPPAASLCMHAVYCPVTVRGRDSVSQKNVFLRRDVFWMIAFLFLNVMLITEPVRAASAELNSDLLTRAYYISLHCSTVGLLIGSQGLCKPTKLSQVPTFQQTFLFEERPLSENS